MYIHIGGEYSLSDKFIIAIIDLNTVLPSQTDMNTFLAEQEESGQVEYVSTDIPQSVIIALDRIYVTGVSTDTLMRRIYFSGQKCRNTCGLS